MDLPIMPRLLVEQSIIEGNIYMFKQNVRRGIKDHMHVCIKRADKLLFFSTCSSQIDTARNISARNRWSMDTFPIFPKNDATNKFKKDFTYVNCNNYYEFTVEEYVEMLDNGEVELLQGSFSESDMQLIIKGILASPVVEREVKDLFR